jgi:hypothetical protein
MSEYSGFILVNRNSLGPSFFVGVILWRSVLLVEISGKKNVDLETGFLRIFF